MKKYLSFLGALLIIGCTTETPEKQGYYLKGATVYDGNGSKIENASIVVRNGNIDCVGDCQEDESLNTLNLEGKFITPGMVDAHVHFFQTGFYDSRPDALNLTEVFPPDEIYAYQASNPERYYICLLYTSPSPRDA